MRIALVNTIKPQEGSGDGVTEITYRLYQILKRKHSVDLFYPIESSVRNDVSGLAYANTLFKLRVAKLAHSGYDIVHIANQEIGYVARTLKKLNTEAKIVSTIYDVVRTRAGFKHGVVHGVYNSMVSRSTRDAVEYSDAIIFCASSVAKDVKSEFPQLGKNWKVVYLGQAREQFARTPIPKRKRRGVFNVGYVGALSAVKNMIFMLRAAKALGAKKEKYRFTIYGSGAKLDELKRYKEANHLDNVSFRGFAPEKALLKIYDSFDAFFYPGLDESTSITVFNAQARGLPVVLYKDTRLSKEVTSHSIIAKDEKHAAQILEKLRTKGYAARLRAAEVKYVRGFTWEKAGRETEDVYSSVLKRS